jgi:hypothetical protein
MALVKERGSAIIRHVSYALDMVDEPRFSCEPRAARRPLLVRGFSAFLLLVFGGMLGVGMYLKPSLGGLATHTQLGLPPCGFYTRYGVPCPTCGYTTAVTHVAHGQWIQAIQTQPAGAAVGFVAVAAVVLGILGLVTGRWYGPSLFWLGWHWKKLLAAALLVILLAWGYKVLVMSAGFGHTW